MIFTPPPRKLIFSMLIHVLVAVIAGLLLLSAAYMIPAEWMEENAAISSDRMSRELTQGALYPWCNSTLDNSTDSLMMLTASYQNDQQSLVDQAANIYLYMAESGPYNTFTNQIDPETEQPVLNAYSRYWHGYLIFLKPLLCFLSYQPIRYLNGLVQNLLVIFLVFLLVRKKMTPYVLPLVLMVGLMMPVYMAKSFQSSTCYYMMLLGSIAVVAQKERLKEREAHIFLWIGIGTAFFDLLTYPIATVGVPAVLCFAVCSGPRIRDDLRRLFKLCFCWLLGYGGMWFGKWVAASIFSEHNIILDAIRTIAFRTDVGSLAEYGAVSDHPIVYTNFLNIGEFLRTPVTNVVGVTLAVLLAAFIFRVMKDREQFKVLGSAVVFLVIACMPFVWYSVVCNHSLIHFFFTNRALSVTAFSALCMSVKLVQTASHH